MREDREIELQPLLNAPLPKLPLAPVLRGLFFQSNISINLCLAHWLVIDGKQPATPENPSPEVSEFNSLLDPQPSTSTTENNPPVLRHLAKRVRKTIPVQIKTTTTHSVCLEQQIFFKEIMEAIMGNEDSKRIVRVFILFLNKSLFEGSFEHAGK